MSEQQHMHPGAEFLRKVFGPSTEHPIYICSLLNPNARDSEPTNERFVTTRDMRDITGFACKWDRPRRALYWAVNTVKPNARRRCKENVSEINCLHADIDFKAIIETPDEARRALRQLMYPPTIVNFTGHGLHVLWLFKEAIEATPESIAEVEALLRLLADHVGADLQAAEVARLLRLPASHNTKNGEWLEVFTELDTGRRYILDDLRDWLEIARPALHRKPKTNGAGEPVDPFLALAQRQGFHVPIDVEARLRDMRYQGPGDSGIHATQLAVSASLLLRGEPVESVVTTLLDATRVAAGSFGENWNWRREERAIRAMCETWLAKHPFEIRPDPETHTPPPLKEAEISDKASRGKARGRAEATAEPRSEPAEQREPAEETPDGGSAAADAPAASAASQPRTASHTRPMVRIIAGQLPNAVMQSERALIDAGFQIFVRGTLMYLVTETLAASDGRNTKVTKLKEIVADLLLRWLAEAAVYIKYDARSKAWVRCDPPRQLATTLLASADHWPFPPIAGVISSPMLRPDGSLLSNAGYDAATQLYLAPDPALCLPALNTSPTRGEAETALHLLKDLLSEFKFASPTNKSVALSLILTLAARSAMPVAPLHLIRAHTPGTGKSYLVDVGTAIVTGRQCCAVISAATNAEEAEKRLGALLREGITIAALDNCSNNLEGDVLCQLVERPLVRIRILGHSEAPEFECKAVVVATGNNIGPKGDLVRRTLICNLVAETERPELRCFKSDPIARVLANRGAYLAACLTIIRAYQAAGSPDVCEQPIGSYGRWSTVVRSPLVWLGEADPIKSMEAAREEDAELVNIRELFAHWQQHLQADQAYSAFEVAEAAADEHPVTNAFTRREFHDFLLQVAGNRGLVSTRLLGVWLRKIEGRIVDGMRLAVEPAKTGTNRAPKFRLAEVRNDSTSSEEM